MPEETLETKQQLLRRVQQAQDEFWRALRALEHALDVALDSRQDFREWTDDDLNNPPQG